ncbi:Uncharacterised protein [Salmonella enterica subsp. enterica]|nr:Uncharacterised protein [Salmonella enterica subsp. enterica]
MNYGVGAEVLAWSRPARLAVFGAAMVLEAE